MQFLVFPELTVYFLCLVKYKDAEIILLKGKLSYIA